MLSVQSARPDARLEPFIARYVQRETNCGASELVEPVVARLGTMLEFLFADPYYIPVYGGGADRLCPPVTVIGPITARRVQLVIRGHIESLVVLFRPLGLYRFFRTPVSHFAEAGTEGHSAFGPSVSRLYQRLGNTANFLSRKELLDRFFLQQLSDYPALDPRGKSLRLLMSSGLPLTVCEAAKQAGISARHLERFSMDCAGVAPKMLTRVARFERALQLRVQHGWTWMRVAHESEYHDQMHMTRDFRSFAGEAPGTAVHKIAPDHLINFF